MTTSWPTELRLRKDRRVLAVTFEDGESFELTAEYLRVRSPSAEYRDIRRASAAPSPARRMRRSSNCTRSAIMRCD